MVYCWEIANRIICGRQVGIGIISIKFQQKVLSPPFTIKRGAHTRIPLSSGTSPSDNSSRPTDEGLLKYLTSKASLVHSFDPDSR
jgi:hypothetical protein